MANELELIRNQGPLFVGAELPLGLDEYQAFTATTDQETAAGVTGLGFVLLGLFGEVGSLLSELKKKRRDRESYSDYREAVVEEFGDILWYLATASRRTGLTLSGIAARVTATLGDWDYRGTVGPKAFQQIQEAKQDFDGPLSSSSVESGLFSLAARIGTLVNDYESGRLDANRDVLSGDLTELFRAVISAADEADVSLDEAARRNIAKTLGRWPTKFVWGPLFDDEFDEDEQIPRRIEMAIREKDVAGRRYVIQQWRGVTIGDRLTDNREEQDDYRFHDAFHLAYAAILGWSPVMRGLLKVKRKSRPEIDENQDGARATLIEEGVSTLVFNHGLRNGHFAGLPTVDYSLLKAIQRFVAGYEVEIRPAWQWERAILEGFRVFRTLCEYRGGRVIADLTTRSIEVERL